MRTVKYQLELLPQERASLHEVSDKLGFGSVKGFLQEAVDIYLTLMGLPSVWAEDEAAKIDMKKVGNFFRSSKPKRTTPHGRFVTQVMQDIQFCQKQRRKVPTYPHALVALQEGVVRGNPPKPPFELRIPNNLHHQVHVERRKLGRLSREQLDNLAELLQLKIMGKEDVDVRAMIQQGLSDCVEVWTLYQFVVRMNHMLPEEEVLGR